jgi:hypothetical protein
MTQLLGGAGFCGLRGAVAAPADRALGVKAEFQPGAPQSEAVTGGRQPAEVEP